MSLRSIARRAGLLLAAALLASCAQSPLPATAAPALPPIVFVHGNGDSAALWHTTVWRFESNGWPRERLFAIDMPYPQSRDADDVPQPGRSSSTEHREFLAAEVARVLAATGAPQVVLVGNSRGGFAIRSFIMNGGAGQVSHAILGGTPNHGVWADASSRPASEFNGAGPFLRALNNQGAPGVEITPGPKWMTIRSDHNDKFAQPDGEWLGAKGRPTHVSFDSPELKGALNLVLPGADHREVSYSAQAFAVTYRFIAGREPTTTAVLPELRVVLDGTVSGLGLGNDPARGATVNNLPLAAATVQVFATDAITGERIGTARWSKTVGADGRWGPFSAEASARYEFVITAPGYAVTHIYRSPFPRSSALVHLRAAASVATAAADVSVLSFARPRGYFGLPRDRIVFDGQSPPPGVPAGVAAVAVSRITVPALPQRAVVAEFNGERIVGRNWPVADKHVVQLELHD
jgi:triacylglycerol lipase